jgi:copper oxidase (laccase) domain-containing protein
MAPRPGARVHFDLPGYVAGRLGRATIGGIERTAPCTFTNESLFYSYRRSQSLKQPDYGRQISAIVVA